MALYRIFPTQDSTIYSQYPYKNTGRDELLEIGGFPSSGTGFTARALIEFKTEDIQEVLTDKAGGSDFSASLKCFLNFASEIPTSFKVESHVLTRAWGEGLGKLGDNPESKGGCSWTASDSGINWSSAGGDYVGTNSGVIVSASKTLDKTTPYDLDLNVTNAVTEWTKDGSTLANNGLLLKVEDTYENFTSASIRLKYYSSDTNTIYPPYLELKWDDFNHDSGSLPTLTDSDAVITLKNNKGKYADEGKVRFRVNSRPNYPTRTFTTSSAYTVNYALPTASYWGLRDEFTEEMIVDFDTTFTKLSCDNKSNYFDIYLDGLQPERFYKVLIKSEIDGTDVVIDNDQIFKIVRNG